MRPSFAGSRLSYDETIGEVEYQASKGCTRSMDALEWIALVTSHIPDVYEQTVRHCGRYSNASRGKRRRLALALPLADEVDSVAEPDSAARLPHFYKWTTPPEYQFFASDKLNEMQEPPANPNRLYRERRNSRPNRKTPAPYRKKRAAPSPLTGRPTFRSSRDGPGRR